MSLQTPQVKAPIGLPARSRHAHREGVGLENRIIREALATHFHISLCFKKTSFGLGLGMAQIRRQADISSTRVLSISFAAHWNGGKLMQVWVRKKNQEVQDSQTHGLSIHSC